MKKIFLLLFISLSGILLTSCKSKTIEGSWKIASVQVNNRNISDLSETERKALKSKIREDYDAYIIEKNLSDEKLYDELINKDKVAYNFGNNVNLARDLILSLYLVNGEEIIGTPDKLKFEAGNIIFTSTKISNRSERARGDYKISDEKLTSNLAFLSDSKKYTEFDFEQQNETTITLSLKTVKDVFKFNVIREGNYNLTNESNSKSENSFIGDSWKNSKGETLIITNSGGNVFNVKIKMVSNGVIQGNQEPGDFVLSGDKLEGTGAMGAKMYITKQGNCLTFAGETYCK
jgi:hypothetical protein